MGLVPAPPLTIRHHGVKGVSNMYEKNGKFFADWVDETGRRTRKSFTSKAKARAYESAKKEDARPFRAQGVSATSSRRSASARSNNSPLGKPASNSSPQAVKQSQKTGDRTTSPKQSTSRRKATHKPHGAM